MAIQLSIKIIGDEKIIYFSLDEQLFPNLSLARKLIHEKRTRGIKEDIQRLQARRMSTRTRYRRRSRKSKSFIDLTAILNKLKLSEYTEKFNRHGFHSAIQVTNFNELQFDELGSNLRMKKEDIVTLKEHFIPSLKLRRIEESFATENPILESLLYKAIGEDDISIMKRLVELKANI